VHEAVIADQLDSAVEQTVAGDWRQAAPGDRSEGEAVGGRGVPYHNVNGGATQWEANTDARTSHSERT